MCIRDRSDAAKTKIFYREMGSEGDYLPYTITSDTNISGSLDDGYDPVSYTHLEPHRTNRASSSSGAISA